MLLVDAVGVEQGEQAPHALRPARQQGDIDEQTGEEHGRRRHRDIRVDIASIEAENRERSP